MWKPETIEFGVEWNTLELWVVVVDWGVDEDGATDLAGYVELDTGKLDMSKPLHRLLEWVARVVAERSEYIFECLVEDCYDKISEEVLDHLSRNKPDPSYYQEIWEERYGY